MKVKWESSVENQQQSTAERRRRRRDDANVPRSGGIGDDIFTASLHRAFRLGRRLTRRHTASDVPTRGHREPVVRARGCRKGCDDAARTAGRDRGLVARSARRRRERGGVESHRRHVVCSSIRERGVRSFGRSPRERTRATWCDADGSHRRGVQTFNGRGSFDESRVVVRIKMGKQKRERRSRIALSLRGTNRIANQKRKRSFLSSIAPPITRGYPWVQRGCRASSVDAFKASPGFCLA